ncbi:uncharacterized protein LOC118468964 [Anopheles albimanus]|uniref:uncharacterized protein LOC118468964 n=1 Tax=Anopheles albimanus TaxID=7167 RepID=UPI00163F780F|nr:uncharacterized protein LOC118468964 [Anopheles albimanus]
MVKPSNSFIMRASFISVIVTIFLIRMCCAIFIKEASDDDGKHYMISVLESCYRSFNLPVHFRIELEANTKISAIQLDFLNELLLKQNHWMISTVHSSSPRSGGTFYQNVFFAECYNSLKRIIWNLNVKLYDIAGLYIMVIANRGVNENGMKELFSRLWKLRIINVVLIVQNESNKYCAYNYDPYNDGNHCGEVRVKLMGCNMSHICNRTDHEFGNSLRNLNGCTLNVGTFDAKPFSMAQVVDNNTVFVGLEVEIMKISANKLNFSINYITPPGNQKWGVFAGENTTGLMGMLKRSEVDVGFGVTGLNLNLSKHLRSSVPSIISQLTMAIPPRKPYTSLEKLFLPFTLGSWILIIATLLIICCVSLILLYWRNYSFFENNRSVVYTTWVILLGGPGNSVRKHSSRIFMISLILNTFIVRSMYQSQLFTYLRSIDSYASNLNSYDDINGAGLFYYMYPSAKPFFIDNPLVKGRVHIVDEENVDWDDILYNISLHRTKGVMALALESITYYVKQRGQQGMVYVSRDTGISYYIAFHFPKASALKELFDELIYRFYDSGLMVHWLRKYRDNPDTWVNQKKKMNLPLQLHQVSGGFIY